MFSARKNQCVLEPITSFIHKKQVHPDIVCDEHMLITGFRSTSVTDAGAVPHADKSIHFIFCCPMGADTIVSTFDGTDVFKAYVFTMVVNVVAIILKMRDRQIFDD